MQLKFKKMTLKNNKTRQFRGEMRTGFAIKNKVSLETLMGNNIS